MNVTTIQKYPINWGRNSLSIPRDAIVLGVMVEGDSVLWPCLFVEVPGFDANVRYFQVVATYETVPDNYIAFIGSFRNPWGGSDHLHLYEVLHL